MKIPFSKMHGLGNDYLYLNCLSGLEIPDPAALSRFVSPRHFSVGADGLILILPSQVADFRMRVFNADGSEGKMCGNGSRCVAKYVYEAGLTRKTQLSLETASGVKELSLFLDPAGQVEQVGVEMGQACLSPKDIPMDSPGESFIRQPLLVGRETYVATCLSIGNPHAVVFMEADLGQLDLAALGPWFEHHPLFPEQVNTEFVQVQGKRELQMRVWERGSKETMACGTGACAAAVAAVLEGRCPQDEEILVHLRGGDLRIRYREDGSVRMEGSATWVYDGVIDYPV